MKKEANSIGDTVVLGIPNEDGVQMYRRYRSDGSCELGVMMPQGAPVPPEAKSYVTLGHHVGPYSKVVSESPIVRDVMLSSGIRSRPASKEYRSGWDEIFGKQKKKESEPEKPRSKKGREADKKRKGELN